VTWSAVPVSGDVCSECRTDRAHARADVAQALAVAAREDAEELDPLVRLESHRLSPNSASKHTLRSHVKSILRKLDVSSRRQAVEKLQAARG
jgi:hypothetical protein